MAANGGSQRSRHLKSSGDERLHEILDDIVVPNGGCKLWPLNGSASLSDRRRRLGLGMVLSSLTLQDCTRILASLVGCTVQERMLSHPQL
jgi:hypothetical protein